MKPGMFPTTGHPWLWQSGVAFGVSFVGVTAIILTMPLEYPAKSQLALAYLFSMSTGYTLSKNLQDPQRDRQVTDQRRYRLELRGMPAPLNPALRDP